MSKNAVVYFPLSADFLNQKCHFLYGQVKLNVQDESCVYLYVVEVCSKRETSDNRLQLLGTISSDDALQNRKSKSSQVWIQLIKSGQQNASLIDVRLDGSVVQLSDTILVLYDRNIIQSEIVQKNADWKMSQCLTELGNLLNVKRGENKAVSSYQEVVIGDSLMNNFRLIVQLRQRSAQCKVWWTSSSQLVRFNLFLMMVIDLLLGFCFVAMFHSFGGTNKVLEIFLTSVKVN